MVTRWILSRTLAFTVAFISTAGVLAISWSTWDPEFGNDSPRAKCIEGDNAFVPDNALPGFERMVDYRFTEPPVKGGPDGSVIYVRDFVGGGLLGFISDVAVRGPYRVSEDERARSLGYEIGRWPYVPLVGDVVADSGSLLEVYEAITVYGSDDAAEAWAEVLRSSKSAAGAEPVTIRGVPPDATAASNVLGPDDGAHERDEQIVLVRGKAVLRLNFQHSPSVQVDADIARVTGEALKALQRACGPVFDEGGY